MYEDRRWGWEMPKTLKGHLDLLLMAALESRPAHGYAIAELLRTRSAEAFDLPEGTLYPALHRLERANGTADQSLVGRQRPASARLPSHRHGTTGAGEAAGRVEGASVSAVCAVVGGRS